MKKIRNFLAATTAMFFAGTANAADLEVMHWWTSGGEAAAVAEFAKAFDATGHNWVDAAIQGGDNARAVMVSRLIGGDPMGAFQFNHGRQAEELIESGLLRDITSIARSEGWDDVVKPSGLLDACTVDGRIYCAPVNIHSWNWLWVSHKAFQDAGVPVPTNWDEFVAAAPRLEAAGKVPLAMGAQGWQQSGAFTVILQALVSRSVFDQIYEDKDAGVAAGPELAKVFKAADDARRLAANSNVENWNDATKLVIDGLAGGQIMGDWAEGEFAVANQVAGRDYSCLPGLGEVALLGTGGDSFYFPVLNDSEQTAAQTELAKVLLRPETQVNFNLKKGSLPVRDDIDLSAANECMRIGLDLKAAQAYIPDTNLLLTSDTQNQISTLFTEFFADTSISAKDAQIRFAKIIAQAD